MAEYIEREEALKILEDMRLDYENNDCPVHALCEDYVDALETAEDKLNTLIAADVRPERHGRWVFREIATDDGTCYNWCCNQCDCSCSLLDEGIEPDFCPNCGAMMDGKDGN